MCASGTTIDERLGEIHGDAAWKRADDSAIFLAGGMADGDALPFSDDCASAIMSLQ